MASSLYSQRVDLENWNTSHSLAVMSISPGSRVLDLGTGDGSVARVLKERGCTVWGIDSDTAAAEAARLVCDHVIVTNLEACDAFDALDDETFDVVLALDVLEHLREPASVLRRAVSFLSPKGIVVVSIPNVTHGALRLSLLEGRFNYTEQGLLDRTHLRFFDRRSAERLMSDAGLSISQHLRVRRELDETEIAVDKGSVPAEVLESLARDPDATTYQFIFVAGREGRLRATAGNGMLAERLLAENDAMLARFRELGTYAQNLEADRAARIESAAQATVRYDALLSQLRELEDYTKKLDADRTARIEGAARELKQHDEALARARDMHAEASRESHQLRLERDELRQELTRRLDEAHQSHLALRHCKADIVFKEAFIADLRQQLLAIEPLIAQRDQLVVQQDQWLAQQQQLLAEREQLLAEREQLLDEHGQLLAERSALIRSQAEVNRRDAVIAKLHHKLDRLVAERDQSAAERKRLMAERRQLSAQRDHLVSERSAILKRQDDLETSLRALRTYTKSAAFRIVEGMIRRLRSMPGVYRTASAMARKIAGGSGEPTR